MHVMGDRAGHVTDELVLRQEMKTDNRMARVHPITRTCDGAGVR